MRCNKCGNEISDNSQVCPVCGTQLLQAKQNTKTKKTKRKVAIIAAVSAVLIVLIIVVNLGSSLSNDTVYEYTPSDGESDILDEYLSEEGEENNTDESPNDMAMRVMAPVGTEELQYPAQNDIFTYNVYETYVEITGICAEEIEDDFEIPSKIEKLPVRSIGEYAFGAEPQGLPVYQEYGWEIKSLVIPDSVYNIDKGAFCYCTKLEKIDLGKGIVKLGVDSFRNTAVKKLTLPDSLVLAADSAFKDCEDLTQVSFGTQMDYVGDRMFEGCNQLTVVNWGKSIQTIGMYAFSHSGLSEFNIPNTVVEIQTEAFSYCENLINFAFPDSVNVVGERVLSNCDNLKKVVIGNGMNELPENFFASSLNIVDLYIPNSVETIGNLFSVSKASNLTVHGKPGSAAASYAAEYGYKFETIK